MPAKKYSDHASDCSYSRKFTSDVHFQTCLVTGTKVASTSTYDLDSSVNVYGDEEADLLEDAMALQSPNLISQVNLNPFTNPFYDLLSFDDPLDYLLWTELDGESACAKWILKNESFFGDGLGVHIIPTCDNDVCDDIIPNCDNDVCNDIIRNSDNDVCDGIFPNCDKDQNNGQF
ncbi:hypothetical protein CEXT_745841 [Caerostris extrusa]|uniref:Uncharacterized protein n=1 Tax=Caerostris extrusa TaxID=172846 RepID=A0AAV4XKF4_CAEEX|nr:hypothetical protein CEXT_745841 [Caerostris extrusa]